MKKLIIITLISLTLTNILNAQNKSENIHKLTELLNAEATVQGILNEIKPLLFQKLNIQFEGENATDKNTEYSNYVSGLLNEISKEVVNKDLFKTLDDYFTEEELETIIDFYNSPTGQKLIKINPTIKENLTNAIIKNHLANLKVQMVEKYQEIK